MIKPLLACLLAWLVAAPAIPAAAHGAASSSVDDRPTTVHGRRGKRHRGKRKHVKKPRPVTAGPKQPPRKGMEF